MANKVTVENRKIYLRMDFVHVDKCRSVTGARWDRDARAWVTVASPAVAREIMTKFAGVLVEMDPAFVALVNDAAEQDRASANRNATDLPPIPLTRTDPWTHQLQAYHFIKAKAAAALYMEMGTGKSKVAVDDMVNCGAKVSLIICPLAVVNVWPKQFRLHAGRDVIVVPLKKGTLQKRVDEAKRQIEMARRLDKPVVIVINYESAWRDPFAAWALGQVWDMVVLDESHRIKAPGGKAALFCGRLGQVARRRRILTGTPMPHSPLDVYAQYRFLDRGVFGTSFQVFKTKWAVMGGYGGHEVLGYVMNPTVTLPNGQETRNRHYDRAKAIEWEQKLWSLAFRVKAGDVLDLPEAIHAERTFQLESKARRIYDQLEENFYADVEAGEITASNALTRLLRLQQVTSGYVPLDGGGEEFVDAGKMDVLADILEDLPAREPVVVFCRFANDLDNVRRVVESMERRYGELSGRRNDLTQDSTMPDTVDVLAVQIQAGGAGIDLTRARYAVYYSVGFSLGDFDQSVARIHRPGQSKTCYYYHLIAESTVDRKVYSALRGRKNVVEAAMSKGLGDADA